MAPRARGWHGLSVNGVLDAQRRRHGAVLRRRLRRDRHRRRQRAGARRSLLRGRRDAARRGCGSPTRRRIPPGVDLEPRRRRRTRAARRPSSCCARSGTSSSERDPDYGAGRDPRRARRATCAASTTTRPRSRTPSAWNGARAAMARLGGLIPPALLERSLAGEPALTREGWTACSQDHDVLLTPATATPPPRIGQLQGRGALWTLNAVAGMVPYNGDLERHRPARRVGARRLRRRRAAARGSARRAARATRRRCSRSPPSSRPSARGRSSARPGSRERHAEELAARWPSSAARMAGALLHRSASGRGAEREVSSKSTPTDLVSEADLAVRAGDPRAARARAGPRTASSARRAAASEGTSGLSWVVDPLDGTVNFLFGIPAVVRERGRARRRRDARGRRLRPQPRRAVHRHAAHGPASAAREGATRRARAGGPDGGRAQLRRPSDGARRRDGRHRPRLRRATCATAQAAVLARLIPRVRDIRRFGSAALDLAGPPPGATTPTSSAPSSSGTSPPARSICERAGLRVLELPVREDLPWGILAARPGLAEALLEIVG